MTDTSTYDIRNCNFVEEFRTIKLCLGITLMFHATTKLPFITKFNCIVMQGCLLKIVGFFNPMSVWEYLCNFRRILLNHRIYKYLKSPIDAIIPPFIYFHSMYFSKQNYV